MVYDATEKSPIRFYLFALLVALFVSACAAPEVTDAPPSDGEIYFVARTVGPASQIEKVPESGDSEPVLESNHWRDLHPDVGPNGQVVFMSNRRTESDIDLSQYRERFQIFMTDAEGEDVQPLTDLEHSAITPKLGPDGISIAYVYAEPDSAELHWKANIIAEPAVLVTARDILDFDWSPDGETLATVAFEPGDSRIEFLSPTDQQPVRDPITAPENTAITGVSWSPTGEYLAYVLNSREGARHLYLYHLPSGDSRRLSHPEHHVQQPVNWSADGQHLLYASLVDFEFSYDEQTRQQVYRGGMQVFLTPLDGPEQQLTEGDARHGAPVFSPDGQRIAYLYADELDARRLTLRTMDLEGSNIRNLHDNVATESFLQWLVIPDS